MVKTGVLKTIKPLNALLTKPQLDLIKIQLIPFIGHIEGFLVSKAEKIPNCRRLQIFF